MESPGYHLLPEDPLDGPHDRGGDGFADAVRAGLSAAPKKLPCRYFYDAEGSRLFEEICTVEEYYLTRAEREILERRADEIASHLPAGTVLAELGSGSAAKTRLLIASILKREAALVYMPIDISGEMLERSSRELVEEYPTLAVRAVRDEYERGLRRMARDSARSSPAPARLLLWLGSSIGNLDRQAAVAFLREIATVMSPRDRFLVGIDLRKDPAQLESAYDDAGGVTAQFNLNLLARINRELAGEFALERFRHRAEYDAVEGRVRMFLESRAAQTVRVATLDREFEFGAGERIHTEDCYKYSIREIDALARGAGLDVRERWLDGARRFSLNLLANA